MHPIREKAISLLCGFALIFTFLLPLKFGSIAAIPEVPLLFPDSLVAWLIITWPNSIFSFATAVFLITTLIVIPRNCYKGNYSLALIFCWILLALSSLLGIIHATTKDFAYMQVVHLLGIASFATAVYLIINARPDTKKWFVAVIVCATFLTCLWGFHQALAGFEETRNFVYQQEIKSGVTHGARFYTRLRDNRVFSTFSLSNSFAAHLILTIPLCLWFAWTICGAIDPPKITRSILMPIICGILFLTLWYTISRAAVLSLGIAVILSIWLLPFPKRLAFAVTLLAGLMTVIGIALVNVGRSFMSLNVRLDYFYVALKTFWSHLLTGAGWGDFFHEYTKLKLLVNDEAPHTPHNMALAFASQAGLISLIISLLVIIIPIACIACWLRHKYSRRCKKQSTLKATITILEDVRTPILIGWLAWSIHAMADINIQIPASVATAILLLCLYMPNVTIIKLSPYRKAAILLLALSIGCGTLWGSYRLVRSEYAFHQLHTLCDPRFKEPKEFAGITIYQMQKYLANCQKKTPYSPFPYTIASDFAMYKRMPSLAERYMSEAIKRSPDRASFYWKLGMIQLFQGYPGKAEKNFFKAKRLFPLNPKYSKIILPEDR